MGQWVCFWKTSSLRLICRKSQMGDIIRDVATVFWGAGFNGTLEENCAMLGTSHSWPT